METRLLHAAQTPGVRGSLAGPLLRRHSRSAACRRPASGTNSHCTPATFLRGRHYDPGHAMDVANSIHDVVQNGRLQQLKFLLNFGVEINDKNGGSLLLTALRIPNEKVRENMFNFLLRKGVSCEKTDSETGRDVLLWACELGREVQVVRLIDQCLGDLNFTRKDRYGYTCLHYAVRRRSVMVVRQIARSMHSFGLSVDVPDLDGATPYIQARRLGYVEIQQVLVSEGKASLTQFDMKYLNLVNSYVRPEVGLRLNNDASTMPRGRGKAWANPSGLTKAENQKLCKDKNESARSESDRAASSVTRMTSGRPGPAGRGRACWIASTATGASTRQGLIRSCGESSACRAQNRQISRSNEITSTYQSMCRPHDNQVDKERPVPPDSNYKSISQADSARRVRMNGSLTATGVINVQHLFQSMSVQLTPSYRPNAHPSTAKKAEKARLKVGGGSWGLVSLLTQLKAKGQRIKSQSSLRAAMSCGESVTDGPDADTTRTPLPTANALDTVREETISQ